MYQTTLIIRNNIWRITDPVYSYWQTQCFTAANCSVPYMDGFQFKEISRFLQIDMNVINNFICFPKSISETHNIY